MNHFPTAATAFESTFASKPKIYLLTQVSMACVLVTGTSRGSGIIHLTNNIPPILLITYVF